LDGEWIALRAVRRTSAVAKEREMIRACFRRKMKKKGNRI
jgi:hypothetical protein